MTQEAKKCSECAHYSACRAAGVNENSTNAELRCPSWSAASGVAQAAVPAAVSPAAPPPPAATAAGQPPVVGFVAPPPAAAVPQTMATPQAPPVGSPVTPPPPPASAVPPAVPAASTPPIAQDAPQAPASVSPAAEQQDAAQTEPARKTRQRKPKAQAGEAGPEQDNQQVMDADSYMARCAEAILAKMESEDTHACELPGLAEALRATVKEM